tara:strand:- start:115012 stop:115572 length:561 start_codon:yes stop_codon:yes gene_type:complete
MTNLRTALFRNAVWLASRPFEPSDSEERVDAIVVLGAPLRPDGQLSLAGRERVAEGVRCFNDGRAPLLVFTGGAAHSAAEAPAMARRAEELGVPREAIVIEDRSATTAENARFTAELLRPHGVRSVWIVSQPFHLRRGRRLFRNAGFDAKAKPRKDSVQYLYPNLAWRWVAREYVAWAAHFILPNH